MSISLQVGQYIMLTNVHYPAAVDTVNCINRCIFWSKPTWHSFANNLNGGGMFWRIMYCHLCITPHVKVPLMQRIYVTEMCWKFFERCYNPRDIQQNAMGLIHFPSNGRNPACPRMLLAHYSPRPLPGFSHCLGLHHSVWSLVACPIEEPEIKADFTTVFDCMWWLSLVTSIL